MPDHFNRIANYETAFGTTIKRGATVEQTAAKGVVPALDANWLAVAMGKDFSVPIRVDPDAWVLPPGAFGESSGPT
jgi:hypothetical protein